MQRNILHESSKYIFFLFNFKDCIALYIHISIMSLKYIKDVKLFTFEVKSKREHVYVYYAL